MFTALCILILSGVVSCKKNLLTPTPKTSIDEINAFDTPGRILGQVNGLYDAAKSGSFLGGRYLIYNDIRAEEFINKLTNSVTGYQSWGHTLVSTSNEVETLWGAIYTTINRVNVFLKGMDDHADKVTGLIGAATASQYKAEAKFLRALCYFDLLTLYARPYTGNNGASPGLPLRLKAETTSANNDLARSSVAEVYTQILADLNDAEAGLPAKYSSSLLNVTRAHRHSAIALKTRVYLSMGKYVEVVTESSKIVTGTAPAFQAPSSGVAHKLESNVANTFTVYTTAESIFSMPMTDADPPGTQNQVGYYFNKPGVGNGEYAINTSTVTATAGIYADTSWKSTDARKGFITGSGSSTYLTKYNKPAPYADYVPIIGYAEILLNYAEAAARTGDLAKAGDLLKAVRNRSDAAYVYSSTVLTTQTELINAILIERRIELLGEGFRSIDLLRLGLPIPAKSNVSAIQPTSTSYIWPIPNSELLANKLMTPN